MVMLPNGALSRYLLFFSGHQVYPGPLVRHYIVYQKYINLFSI